ncbi:hypothetical protein STEG23_022589, partial [Scotinomys teguina]
MFLSNWELSTEKEVVCLATVVYVEMNNGFLEQMEGKWMELENIILSEVTQTQKDKQGTDLLVCYVLGVCGGPKRVSDPLEMAAHG